MLTTRSALDSVLVHQPAQLDEQPVRVRLLQSSVVDRAEAQDVGHSQDVFVQPCPVCWSQHTFPAEQ